MKRLILVVVPILFALLIVAMQPAEGQDNLQDRVAVLETRVAVLEQQVGVTPADLSGVSTGNVQAAMAQTPGAFIATTTDAPGSDTVLVPLGGHATTTVFRFRIADAYLLPASNYMSAGMLVVTFEITNTSGVSQDFGLPDNPITVTMDNGSIFDQNIFATAQIVVARQEWIGEIGPGQTLNQSSAFVIGMPSTGIVPAPLYVSYWEGGNQGTEYRLTLPTVS